MTESKFTQSPSGNELVSKINGVIDDLGNKVDTDLSNINPTQSVKDTIVGWGMPDYTAGVSKGTSGFTADADGWLLAECGAYGGQSRVDVNGHWATGMGSFNATSPRVYGYLLIPISKNDVITVSASSGYADAPTLTFYPCKGGN